MTTRREFLKAAVLLAAPLGCAGVPVVPARPGDRVLLGQCTSVEAGVVEALEQLDMSWLRPGDSVFVKVACNSGSPPPGVTSPHAVRALCRSLRARGAGRILVGDQAGVSHVRLAPGERRHSSTRALMEQNGLLRAIVEGGAEPHLFDDQGFRRGYVPARLPRGSSAWPTAPWIARVAEDVDHIVYLPRLSTHALTGYTHGHKLAVGWMRDDTRFLMHNQAADIYEKYTELNYCEQIATRLRLVLTAVDHVMVDGGPDFGEVAVAAPALVLASSALASHDAVSVPLLTWAREHLPRAPGGLGIPAGLWSPLGNAALVSIVEQGTGIPWRSGDELPTPYFAHDWAAGVPEDRALRCAYELLGGAPDAIAVTVLGAGLPSTLAQRLASGRPAVRA